MLARGDTLSERVCTEKLVGAAQEFADAEFEDPILRDIDSDDRVARNPCLWSVPPIHCANAHSMLVLIEVVTRSNR
jgi:hypothetical protein